MALLGLTLMFLLLFEDISGQIKDIPLYHRPADDVILSCDTGRSCPTVQWLYNRDLTKTDAVVHNGNVVKNSARAARVSLNSADCSLVIKNITAEDAGLYTCRQRPKNDIYINLNIITISLSPPDADLKRDDTIMVDCSLLGFNLNERRCQQQRIRWVDEAGSELLVEGVGHKVIRQRNCLSSLTVKRHSGLNRKYTCQVLDRNNKVLINANYTPVFTGTKSDDQSNTDNFHNQIYIITGSLAGLILVLLITAVIIKSRQKNTVTDEVQKIANSSDPQVEPGCSMTYVTIDHTNQNLTSKKKVKEDTVTYSTVNTQRMREENDEVNRIYSNISG